jgi:uncharacterized protein YkwD
MLTSFILAASVAYIKPSPARLAYVPVQQQMLADLNATRRRAGLRPLALETRLSSAASGHAADMATHNFFDHTGRDGRSPFERMRADGCRFSYAGENIAESDSEREAYAALLASPEHRENIMDPHYSRVGIGIAAAPDGSLLFVQDFSD